MLINCTDTQLINFLNNRLDNVNIKYTKEWRSKYNIYVTFDYEPINIDDFQIKYEFKTIKELNYFNKIAKDFINKREYLERCLCISE